MLPDAVSKDRDTMAFLLRIGLRKEIDDLPFLIVCARSLARVQQTWKAQGQSGRVMACIPPLPLWLWRPSKPRRGMLRRGMPDQPCWMR